MAATVDAHLPLSLLQAVRQLDTPEGEVESEYLAELRSKRLGLSDTVHQQIRRYGEAVRRSQRTTYDEAVALARLLGRRPDAPDVFRWAGRHLAVQAYQTLSPTARRLPRTLPTLLARPIALRHARRLAARFVDGTVARRGSSVLLQVPVTVTADATPNAVGCALYGAWLAEVIRLLLGHDAAVEHVRCAERGEGRCEWRVEWKKA
jgi:predicted hydrocarbon binding protein